MPHYHLELSTAVVFLRLLPRKTVSRKKKTLAGGVHFVERVRVSTPHCHETFFTPRVRIKVRMSDMKID